MSSDDNIKLSNDKYKLFSWYKVSDYRRQAVRF